MPRARLARTPKQPERALSCPLTPPARALTEWSTAESRSDAEQEGLGLGYTGQAEAFAAGKDLGKYIVNRFAKPVVDDPGLPIADALVCISSTVFFATVILATGAPRPSWLVAAPWVPKWCVRPRLLPPSSLVALPPHCC